MDMIANSIVAIDAIPFSSRGLGAQLGARPLHRELNKALVGFGARGVELEHATRLSTGVSRTHTARPCAQVWWWWWCVCGGGGGRGETG